MLVLDASAIIDLLLHSAGSDRIRERVFRPGESLHAPHLLDLEVAHALRRLTRSRDVTPARAQRALDHFTDLVIRRYPHTVLLDRVWQLRHGISVYDAAYVALAEALAAPLLTRDGRLASASGHAAEIELI